MKKFAFFKLLGLPTLAVVTCLGLSTSSAVAQGRLTVYCSVDEPLCNLMVAEFEKKTGIDVSMTRKSSGETFAQIRAEASNPKGDVWWGGTGDPHLQAAEEGFTEAYRSPMLSELYDWAVKQAEQSDYHTVGIYSGMLGYGYNTEIFADRNLPVPQCWNDLSNEAYRGEVQVANPNASGTAYTLLATLVQLMGEDVAFAYLEELHDNVNQYTKSGSAPIKAAARGETGIGIVFMHDALNQVAAGFPIKVVAPCEGTGYEIGSMSIIKDARNMEEAKVWYDWALTPEAQNLALEVKQFRIPSNRDATIPEGAPTPDTVRLIDYDFQKYGSSEERKRLLSRWDDEIGSLP